MRPLARRGFTLWEIGLTLILVGVVTAVALPAFTRLGADEPNRPVDVVLRVLRDARRLAIDRGITVSVFLDPASRRYRVDTVAVNAAGTIVDSTLELEPGTTLVADSTRLRFTFFPDGAAMADSVIIRGSGPSVVVVVDPWSGLPRADVR